MDFIKCQRYIFLSKNSIPETVGARDTSTSNKVLFHFYLCRLDSCNEKITYCLLLLLQTPTLYLTEAGVMLALLELYR